MFGSKKSIEKKAEKVRRRGMPACDIHLRSCEAMLDSGVVVERKPDNSITMVGDLKICNSPSCSGRNLS